MRKILTIALALTLCSSAAMAAKVGVYSDANGSSCSLNPAAFQLINVYVTQSLNAESRGAKFKINDLLGLQPTGQVVTTGFLSIGTWYAGIEIATPSCVIGDFVLGSLGYFHQMEVMNCARTIEVVPHPLSEIPGEVITADCTLPFSGFHAAQAGRAFGGPDAQACGGCDQPLATSEKTWGSIKALYR
jgi:hypothetical protein